MGDSEKLVSLHATRTELEERSRSLEEEQKNLECKTSILEEKIAISELENSNRAKRENIHQLESKAGELEHRLKALEMPEGNKSTNEAKPEAAATFEPNDEALCPSDAIETELERAAEAAPVEDDMSVEQEETAEDSKRHSEKRKHRLF